jgi:hypothetical protein
MKEFIGMASISDGELKCACAKEICQTCEYKKLLNCQEATVIVKDEGEAE